MKKFYHIHMDAVEKALGEALAEECRKLHRGELVELEVSPPIDANAIRGIESAVRGLYRGMFGGELKIVTMRRDEDHVLHITLAKQE